MTTTNRGRAILKTSLILCSLIATPVSAAVQQQQESVEQVIERVKQDVADDDWYRARRGLRQALTLNPDSAEAHFLSAQVYLHEKAKSAAIESLEKATTARPIYPEAYFLLARSLFEAGRQAKARDAVNTAISQGTPLFSAYLLAGEIDFAENKVEAAIASFETALRFAQSGDEKAAAKIRVRIDNLLETIENLKRFAVLDAEQTAPDIVRPFPLNLPAPAYTDEARSQKIQGSVSMAARVTENGDVDSVLMFRRLGYGLDERAEETARQLKFSPATKNGKPIPYWTKVSVDFNLR
ncbi:MAG: TonB family protein [Acidobacteriota bacterium]